MIKKESVEYIKNCFEMNNEKVLWSKRPRCHFKNNQVYSMWNNRYPGNIAGSKTRQAGYDYYSLVVKLNGRSYSVGHIAWVLHYNEWPDQQIDHVDGNVENNSKENLRVVSSSENNKNRKKHRNNTTGHTGVSFSKSRNKYVAYASLDKKLTVLGYFDKIEEAISERLSALGSDPSYTSRHGE